MLSVDVVSLEDDSDFLLMTVVEKPVVVRELLSVELAGSVSLEDPIVDVGNTSVILEEPASALPELETSTREYVLLVDNAADAELIGPDLVRLQVANWVAARPVELGELVEMVAESKPELATLRCEATAPDADALERLDSAMTDDHHEADDLEAAHDDLDLLTDK